MGGAYIYKIDEDLGFENWNFGLDVESPRISGADLRLTHRAGAAVRHTSLYDSAALGAFVQSDTGSALALRNLHFRFPASVGIDNVLVEFVQGNGLVARARIALQRYQQRGSYRLPFTGCWFVSSGHDFGVEHRRHLTRGHFAWDFLRVDGSGRSSTGDSLDDSFAFGQPVLAPADGVVVEAVGHFPDQKPGVTAEDANYVNIDHGNGEISRMVHLRNGSLTVNVGESVRRGDLIGQVGNSGQSDAPHLHFAFQTAGDGSTEESQLPLPVLLDGYRASSNQETGGLVRRGRPRRGQFVCAE